MHISAAFHSGNIVIHDASDPADVRLAIRPDAGGEHYQWFHFRVVGARGVPCVFRLVNAAGASYPAGWPGYRACVSADRTTWRRVQTSWDGAELTIAFTPEQDCVYVAYFAPYPLERHLDRLAAWGASPRVRHAVLGATVDGRDLDHLVIGHPGADRPVVWVIARQHPGETMAQWFIEGLVDRLVDPSCGLARRVLDEVVFHVVPNMNPDGAARGHLRTNAAGVNLNRAWEAPDFETSPEVRLVRDAMDVTGVDLCLDVHGDEAIPHTFVAGAEGIVGYTAWQAAATEAFGVAWQAANPDFQRVHGYPPDPAGGANMTMCTSQIAARFGALALTLEMPFKDNADAPDPDFGWSAGRSRAMGASVLHPIAAVLGLLRDRGARRG